MEPIVLKAGNDLIPFKDVEKIDISNIENGTVTICMKDGTFFIAKGFDAIETIMVLKPSAIEGRRLRWKSGAWAFHNICAHPILQVLAWLGFKRAAVRFHDWTTPTPRGFK